MGSDQTRRLSIKDIAKKHPLEQAYNRFFRVKNSNIENKMARANRHYISGHVWHLTHRCHKRFGNSRDMIPNFKFKYHLPANPMITEQANEPDRACLSGVFEGAWLIKV